MLLASELSLELVTRQGPDVQGEHPWQRMEKAFPWAPCCHSLPLALFPASRAGSGSWQCLEALVLCPPRQRESDITVSSAAHQCHLQQSHCPARTGTRLSSAQVTVLAGVSLQAPASAALLITLFSAPLSTWQKVFQPEI